MRCKDRKKNTNNLIFKVFSPPFSIKKIKTSTNFSKKASIICKFTNIFISLRPQKTQLWG